MKFIEITTAIALFIATCTEARKLNDLPDYTMMIEIYEKVAAGKD